MEISQFSVGTWRISHEILRGQLKVRWQPRWPPCAGASGFVSQNPLVDHHFISFCHILYPFPLFKSIKYYKNIRSFMFASFDIILRQTHPVDWFMTSSPRLVFVHWPLQYVKLRWAEFGVFHRICQPMLRILDKFQLKRCREHEQGLVTVPFWEYWTLDITL